MWCVKKETMKIPRSDNTIKNRIIHNMSDDIEKTVTNKLTTNKLTLLCNLTSLLISVV